VIYPKPALLNLAEGRTGSKVEDVSMKSSYECAIFISNIPKLVGGARNCDLCSNRWILLGGCNHLVACRYKHRCFALEGRRFSLPRRDLLCPLRCVQLLLAALRHLGPYQVPDLLSLIEKWY
jgi:hypothetical protein